jgi:hypothetical protein
MMELGLLESASRATVEVTPKERLNRTGAKSAENREERRGSVRLCGE